MRNQFENSLQVQCLVKKKKYIYIYIHNINSYFKHTVLSAISFNNW